MKHELKILIVATIFSILVCWIVFTFSPSYFRDFAPEFLAVLLGLVIVFGSDRYIESWKKDQDREDLLRALRVELGRIRETPITEGIYPDIWDSSVSSGKLSALLSSKQVIKLTEIYRSIRELDNERRLVEQAEEDCYHYTGGSADKQAGDLRKRWQAKKLTHENNTHDTNKKIETILQDEKLWDELAKKIKPIETAH